MIDYYFKLTVINKAFFSNTSDSTEKRLHRHTAIKLNRDKCTVANSCLFVRKIAIIMQI